MPNSIVTKLIEEVATLKAQVSDLLTWQKWQMGVLAVVIGGLILNLFK